MKKKKRTHHEELGVVSVREHALQCGEQHVPRLYPLLCRTPILVHGSGFRVQGSGFRVQGPGSRVGATCAQPAPSPLPHSHPAHGRFTRSGESLFPQTRSTWVWGYNPM